MRFSGICAIAVLSAAALNSAAGDVANNVRHIRKDVNMMNIEYAAKNMEAVLPRGSAPDLKGGDKGWEKAWKIDRFTVTYKQAVNYAHALQGGGEWKEWLEKTLIPRAATQVRMLCDEKNLYIQIKCTQKRLAELLKVPVKLKRDGAVWTNENVDVLIAANRNSNDYFQFLIDCKGHVYDAHQLRNDPRKSSVNWNPDFYKHISYGKDYWCLTLALPVTQWGLSLKDGAFIDCNIGRVELFNHENSTLSPVDAEFKQADRFCRFWIGRKSYLPGIAALKMVNPLPGKNTLAVTVSNPAKTAFSGSLQSGGETMKITVPAGTKKLFNFSTTARSDGKLLCQVKLVDSNNIVVDQAAGEAIVKLPMSLKLSATEYISGGEPLHAVITVNDLRKDSTLEITCGSKKEVMKADSVVEFDFVPESSVGETDFQVTLLDGGKKLFSVSRKIIVAGDPFDE